MVFSKDMKSPTATSLSTASTEAEELEQEDESPGQPGLSELFASHASASPSSPSSPTHNNAWEVELETQLLAEMRRVTQGYTLLPARPAMTALQAMLKDDASKLPHTEEIKKIVTLLEQLIAELERFHSSDKNPTVNQREAQRSIAQLVTRVPAGLIAAMQVSQEGDPLTPDASQHEIYWAVEKANAAQEEVHALGKAFKKMNESHRNALMSGEEPLLSSVLILATALGAALRQLEDRLIADQNAYSTKAQRKTWTDMRDALKDQLVLHPESVEARMSSIARLHDALASGNTPPTEGYRSLSTLVGHILNTRVQNPRELHAISMLATLALDVGTIFQHTVTGGVKSDIDGAQETATAPAIKQALDVVIEDIDTVRLFLSGGVREGAIKNTPLFNAWDLLPTLKGNLSSINVKVTQQTAFYESEQRRVSLETLRETLTSTAKVDPKTSGEWGIDKLILVAEALLSLEGEKDRRHDAALGNLAERLDKTANGVLSARAMMSAVPREDDNTMPVTAKMLEYAEKHAQKGAAQAQALVISRSSQSRGLVVPLLMRDNFKAAAGGLQTARSHLSSETYRQKMTRKLQHEGRDVGHIANKVVSTVSHTQLKHDKWKAATLPWVGSHAKPVAAGIQRHLRACLYPVIEALTLLKMTAYLEQESLTFKRQYGSTGRSKDRRYDDGSRERYRQASVKTGQAFPWVQEKIAVFVSTLPALGEQPLDAGTTAAVQEFMAGVIPQLAHVDRLSTDWDAARKQQSKEGMSKVIWKIGNIKSAIKKAAELSVGAPQSIYADENKRVRYVGDFLAAKKAKHLAEHPQEGARFDKKVTALLQQHAAELAPAKYGDMAHLLQDAYIAADNNMQLQLPTTEDVVKGMPGFWTKLAGSGPQSLLRRTGRMAVSGTVEMLFILSGAKVVGSIALKSLMFAFSLYKVDSALELARKPWEAADVTTAARWAVMDTLFRQFLFRITKSVLPLGALKVLLPVGQSVYLLTRGDGTALLSGKFTVRKVAEEAVWEGGSQGVSLAGNALGKGHDKSDAVAASENGEIVQGGVSQNNTAAFPGTDKDAPGRAGRQRRRAIAGGDGSTEMDETLDGWDNSLEGGASHRTKLPSNEEIAQQRDALNAKLIRLNNPILHHTQRIDDHLNAELKKNNIDARLDDYISVKLVPSGGKSSPNTDGPRQPQPTVVYYRLRDMLTGTYLYDLNKREDPLGREYTATIKGKYSGFINNFDRTKLQGVLEKETDDYFTEEVKEERSGFTGNIIKARVIGYLAKNHKESEFYQCVSDFYDNKKPAKELYMQGVKVPGFFCFTVEQGSNTKTLVLNIYNDKEFVLKTEMLGRNIPFVWNSTHSTNSMAKTMRFSSDWPAFNETVMAALPLFEKFRYAGINNPFKYEKKDNYDPISFKDGPYRNKLASTITDDIHKRTKDDYDIHIYSNKEEMVDVALDMFRKYAALASVTTNLAGYTAQGAAMKVLLVLVTLGIDATSAGAIFTQAYMADRPDKYDAMMQAGILECQFIGMGIVDDTAGVAVASYKALKPIYLRGLKSLNEVDNLKSAKQLPLGDARSATTSKTSKTKGNAFARHEPSTSSAVSPTAFPSNLEIQPRPTGNIHMHARRYEEVTLIAPVESRAKTLVVNAHGGYYGKPKNPLDIPFVPLRGSPAIPIPDDLTVSFMGPHGKYLKTKPGNEVERVIKAKPYASVNNKHGVKIHNNTADQTVNPAGSLSAGKAATGVSDAKQNGTGTLVRDTTHTEFVNKYPGKLTKEQSRSEDFTHNKNSVAQVFQNAKNKGDTTLAADMLTINPNKEVKLSTLLKMINEDPHLNQYDEVIMVACRNKMNHFFKSKTHYYKGTEEAVINKGMTSSPTSDNKMVWVRMVFIRHPITRQVELKEFKELDEVAALDTELEEKSSLETQADSSPNEASKMLKEFTDSSAKDHFDEIKLEMKSRVVSGLNSLQAMKEVMIENGYTNLRSRLVRISYKPRGVTSYYAVVGTKNGQDFVIDGLAGRSGLYGIEDMSTPLFLSENKWKDEYDAKLKGKASYKFTDTKLSG